MKRFFAFAGLMTAAAISLTNCQPKELGADVLPAGKTIYLSASTDDGTKTTNDGMKTLWEAQDTLNVFFGNAESGFTSLGKATIADGAGTTSATLAVTVPSSVTLPSGAATWYAFFPYLSKMEAPDGATGWGYLGHSKGVNQDGWGSMAHLRGNVCPMYAVAEGSGSTASFSMKHLTSVIEFNVTNSTSSEIIVNKITYKASEDIVGTYYYNITGSDVVYTPSGASYVYDSASVNIEDSTLTPGESGKVYLPVKPYTQSGAVTITVNCTVAGKAVETVITKTPSGDQAVFAPGKIKKVNVQISSLEEQSDKISEVHAAASGSTVVVKDVIVSSVMKQGFFVTDNTDVLLVFLKAAPSVTAGQKVTVSGTTRLYQGNKQINNEPAPEISVSGEGKVTLSPVTYTGSDVDAAFADNNAKYVTVEATATSTTLASVEGAESVLYISNNNRAEGVTLAKDKKYTLTGYVYGHGTYSGTKQVYFYAESATEVGGTTQEATLSVSPASVDIPQEGGSAEVTVTSDNSNWSVDNSTLGDWLSCSVSGNVITFSASANTGTKRSSTVTVKHSNGTLTKTVKVSQDGALIADALNLSAASISFGSTGNEPFVVNVTCNNSNWTIDSSTVPSWLTVTTDTQSDPMTITVVAQDNTGAARNAEIVVNHSNGELSRTLKVGQNAASSGGTATYVKVTSVSALTDGQYLIVNEEGGVAMNGGLTSLDAAGNVKSVTISGNSITWSGDDIYFTYNSSEKSLCGAGGAYLAHKDSNKNNILNDVKEYDEATCKLDISFDADGNVVIAPPTGYNLRYNATSDQNRFRFYKSTSSQKLIQLYKKQ